MLSMTMAARESRCRRLAAKFGLMLRKSRRDCDYGHYALINVRHNCIVYGTDNSGWCVATLDDIEWFLSDAED